MSRRNKVTQGLLLTGHALTSFLPQHKLVPRSTVNLCAADIGRTHD
jgi:hypothetical protein